MIEMNRMECMNGLATSFLKRLQYAARIASLKCRLRRCFKYLNELGSPVTDLILLASSCRKVG